MPIAKQHFILIIPWEHVLAIQHPVVNGANTEHVTLCSKSSICQVLDLQDLGRNEAWSAAADEDVLGLIDACSQAEVNDLDRF